MHECLHCLLLHVFELGEPGSPQDSPLSGVPCQAGMSPPKIPCPRAGHQSILGCLLSLAYPCMDPTWCSWGLAGLEGPRAYRMPALVRAPTC